MYQEMLILFILNNCPPKKRNLSMAYTLLYMMGTEDFTL